MQFPSPVATGLGLLLAATPVGAGATDAPLQTSRPDRGELLAYRDSRGAIQPVRSAEAWERRRAEIVRAMESVMGPLPGPEKRCALDVTVEEETDCGGYVRRLITYASEPKGRVPAYLLIPKEALDGRNAAPAVLCLHPTDDRTGHGVVVGLGGKPNRDYARQLAARGYVALAPSYPLLAKYRPDLEGLGWRSGTLKAVWDNIRGLDLLDSLPFVKHGRYGAIGHSLGGHNAIFTAVFDARIRAIVSSCGFDSFRDYYGGDPARWKPGQGWCQDRYMPRLADYAARLEEIPFDFHEMIGALAPRPVFINAPLGDANFRWQSVDRVAAAASRVYRLLGKPGNLRVEHPDCDHDFPEAMREIACRLFDAQLR